MKNYFKLSQGCHSHALYFFRRIFD